jgi:hypothetical protein
VTKKRRTDKGLGGRPKRVHPIAPETGTKMIRRMPLALALMIFGPHRTAEEMMRRDQEHCEETGRRYDRKSALEKAANSVGLDQDVLENWLRRPKQYRARYY